MEGEGRDLGVTLDVVRVLDASLQVLQLLPRLIQLGFGLCATARQVAKAGEPQT